MPTWCTPPRPRRETHAKPQRRKHARNAAQRRAGARRRAYPGSVSRPRTDPGRRRRADHRRGRRRLPAPRGLPRRDGRRRPVGGGGRERARARPGRARRDAAGLRRPPGHGAPAPPRAAADRAADGARRGGRPRARPQARRRRLRGQAVLAAPSWSRASRPSCGARATSRPATASRCASATSSWTRARAPSRCGGEPVELTAREFDLLDHLSRNPGRAFSRDELMRDVWRHAFWSDTATVTVHVRRLRQKIEVDPAAAAAPRHGLGRRLPARAVRGAAISLATLAVAVAAACLTAWGLGHIDDTSLPRAVALAVPVGAVWLTATHLAAGARSTGLPARAVRAGRGGRRASWPAPSCSRWRAPDVRLGARRRAAGGADGVRRGRRRARGDRARRARAARRRRARARGARRDRRRRPRPPHRAAAARRSCSRWRAPPTRWPRASSAPARSATPPSAPGARWSPRSRTTCARRSRRCACWSTRSATASWPSRPRCATRWIASDERRGALGTLVDDLFELARLDAGDVTWALSAVEVGELVERDGRGAAPAGRAQGPAAAPAASRAPRRPSRPTPRSCSACSRT